jgi:3'(2'), 5'-bisphosphate nucleotidase
MDPALATLAPAWSRELEVAGRLAREAGEIAMRYRDGGDLAVEHKPGDEGPVTAADRAASALIVDGLRAGFPADVVISEEVPDDHARLTAERVWYVDPIDGTKDYIRGDDGFCVMIGLCLGHRPALGAILQPISRHLFVAAPGAGAWVLSPDEGPRRLAVSDIVDLTAVRMVSSKSHRTPDVDRVKSVLGIADEINVGSIGLKLALIAGGDRDLYVNPSHRTSLWDTCGPEAILHEAGGLLTDLDGAALRYDRADVHHPRGLVATNTHIHDRALVRLGEMFPRR